MRKIFHDPETEAILIVDATNAFNILCREAALHNIKFICPELSMFVQNMYGGEAELFVANSEETLLSKEGTTQGGPESMGFCAASTTLLASAHESAGKAKKLFYADDGSGGGKLIDILDWWRLLSTIGWTSS